MSDQRKQPARYVMIGGFLGAGKSTAVLKLAQRLKAQGLKVGLITNDQSVGLVDTAFLKSHGFSVEEIPGGCFCCKFDSLVAASRSLETRNKPDVFIAEPVGSCTDLVATVTYPLRRMFGEQYAIAPLSVMVDPTRAARVLGLIEGKNFSEKVVYVYNKQLEEAEIIVINKADSVDAALLEQLRDTLTVKYPQAQVLTASCREETGLDEWFTIIEQGEAGQRPTMEIDYDTYAEGEALLGWLNATLRVESAEPIDAEKLMMEMAESIQQQLNDNDCEVAHLKMTLTPDHMDGRTAVLNLVRNDLVPELSVSLPEKARDGQLIVNLRAEAPPKNLRNVLDHAIYVAGRLHRDVSISLEHAEQFRPGRPKPTWRMNDAVKLKGFARA